MFPNRDGSFMDPSNYRKAGPAQAGNGARSSDVYMQEIPASVQSTINSINLELLKSQARSRKSSTESASTGAVGNSRRRPSARVTPNDTKSLRGGSSQLPAYA